MDELDGNGSSLRICRLGSTLSEPLTRLDHKARVVFRECNVEQTDYNDQQSSSQLTAVNYFVFWSFSAMWNCQPTN